MSTYDNNLRLEEIGTGERSGTWGTATNTNLSLLGKALGRRTKAIGNVATVTLTMPDATDTNGETRAMFLDLTGGGQACIVTLAPDSVSKVWIIKNSTSYTLTIKQGSGGGASVAIPASSVKVVATDGGGSGAIVYDVLDTITLTPKTVTATGSITGAKIEATGDTAASDNAAIGYTSTEGLILTGQGSNNDVTIKNDADAEVLKILTGQNDITVLGTVKPLGDTSASDMAAIGYTATEGIIITGQGSTNDVTIKNDADATVIAIPTGGTTTTFTGSVKPLTYHETRPTPDTAVTGTKTVDLSTGNVFEHTFTGNVTYTFSNPPASGTAYGFTLKITQGSGGSKIVTWPASVKWTLGVPAVLSTGAGDVDVFTFFTTDGGTTYYGFTVGKRVS
tara:strand:+ start:732 stop:1910 length:1179 start_codon:yes stop_codon:yes gene_type:complete